MTENRLKHWYDHAILPRLIDRVMAEPRLTEHRRACVSRSRGRVLEIGFGTGRNLPFYPSSVERLLAVEPSLAARELASERIACSPFPVEFVDVDRSRFMLDDDSVDSAVSTWTLCTVPAVLDTLRELRRVLRNEAAFSFVEHGLASDRAVARWQHRLTPIHRHLAGGCCLNRDIGVQVQGAGFTYESLEARFIPGPRAWCFFYSGVALKSQLPVTGKQ